MYGHGIKDGVVEKKEQDIKNDRNYFCLTYDYKP